MDQGLAAAWAGIAGLAGAAIGGGAAAWGAWIGGKRTVEAAEKQAQRTATAEHQHWQRQQRFEAYRAVLALAEETGRWYTPVALGEVTSMAGRMREAIAGVDVLGPPHVSTAASQLVAPILAGYIELRAGLTAAGLDSAPREGPFPWPPDRADEFRTAHAMFKAAVRAVLDEPPV